MSPAPKPTPVVKHTVCSLCGLDWKLHKRKTTTECISLLKAELRKRPVYPMISGTGVVPYRNIS